MTMQLLLSDSLSASGLPRDCRRTAAKSPPLRQCGSPYKSLRLLLGMTCPTAADRGLPQLRRKSRHHPGCQKEKVPLELGRRILAALVPITLTACQVPLPR
jgi:hypothetical protein